MLLTRIIKREIKQAIVWALKQPNMEYIVSHHMYHSGSVESIAQILPIRNEYFVSLMPYCIAHRSIVVDGGACIHPLCRPQHTSRAHPFERVCKYKFPKKKRKIKKTAHERGTIILIEIIKQN